MNNSTLRTLDILELLAQSQEPLTVTQVAQALNIPKTSAFDILAALQHKNFVRMADPRAKTYALGLGTYQVGMAYISRMDLYTAAHQHLGTLCRQLGQTVYLAVPEGDQVVYVDKLESDSPIRFTMRTGGKNAMYRTGLGKAILATYPQAHVRTLLPENLPRCTSTTLTTVDEVLIQLEQIRSQGYALDLGEDNELLRCMAVPIRDARGDCIAAISTSMLVSDFEKFQLSQLADHLTHTALLISQHLGYQGNHLYETF